ncbi:hypothetical protein Cva_01382 [Caedimonas varicaedens]|uniref:Uncharacterized protein n=1 Tax=Caedimonas varicaedens TaxID=1629334 RepID=A0A0K8MDV6_9PROT|nr:hypothetical protein Cva_01382 [Caedimonas varicaedens]
MPRNSKKPSLPPRLQKKTKQGQGGQKLTKTLKQVPVKEAVKPDGLLSALEDKARDFVKLPAKPTTKPTTKPQKLAAGGVAKIRLGQSTPSGKQKTLKPRKG